MTSLMHERRVRSAYRQIVRYIHQRQLAPGSELPPQDRLREDLGVGGTVLSTAVRHLASDGVVTARRRVGTIVQDPSRARLSLWTVGLALSGVGQGENFHATVERHVRCFLAASHCEDRSFHKTHAERARTSADYRGLSDALALNELDAVFSFDPLPLNVPLVRIGSGSQVVCGVNLDYAPAIERSLHRLWQAGGRRLQLHVPDAEYGCSNRVVAPHECIGFGKPDIHKGVAIGRRIVTQPAGQRPDGLVVMDDHIAAGVTSALRDAGLSLPIYVLTNRQLPMLFALPVHRIEIDLVLTARLAVDALVHRLTHRHEAPKLAVVAPQLLDPHGQPEN